MRHDTCPFGRAERDLRHAAGPTHHGACRKETQYRALPKCFNMFGSVMNSFVVPTPEPANVVLYDAACFLHVVRCLYDLYGTSLFYGMLYALYGTSAFCGMRRALRTANAPRLAPPLSPDVEQRLA
jgi:hypothetical protein